MNEIKTFDDLKKRLNLTDDEIKNAVNWVNVIEQHFFNAENKKDYRIETIEFCIKNKIDFGVTDNNPYEMLKRYIRIFCPKCHRVMKAKSGGGDSHTHNIGCRCPNCEIEGYITIPVPNGISFHFNFKGD